MRLHTGTSGFAYKEWKGSFYPADLRERDMLAFYCQHFSAVEINNTFYKMPAESMLLSWTEQAPADFTFVLKASQRITHMRRLKDAGEPLGYMLGTAAALGSRPVRPLKSASHPVASDLACCRFCFPTA